MENNDKIIQAWQDKVRSSFGDKTTLYNYLFETMDNFYYRYLETTLDQQLKTQQLDQNRWGASSRETNMVEALKIQSPVAKAGIMQLARAVPKAQAPAVKYELWVETREFEMERGQLIFTAQIDWGFPDYLDAGKRLQQQVEFKYSELAQFRKELALKLEEACSIFL
jgi:hypothetical protein